MKKLFIAEKPSVAQQFADALKVKGSRKDGLSMLEYRGYDSAGLAVKIKKMVNGYHSICAGLI